MRFDYDLVRDIMLKIEESETPLQWQCLYLKPPKTVVYHLEKLIEANYIKAEEYIGNDAYYYTNIELTFNGHQYLDSIKNNETWVNVKDQLKKIGGTTTLHLIKKIAELYVKSKLRIDN